MRELQLDLPTGPGRRLAVERSLRAAIRAGRLAAGTKLPSSRVLADDLGVSRSTVVGAYEQLTAEGFLISEHGRATTVASITSVATRDHDENPMGATPTWDFRPGEPDASAFPRQAWLRSLRRTLSGAPDEVFGYPDPRGRSELRSTLADYLGRTRSVLAEPAAVFVYGGFASALGFLLPALASLGHRRLAVEQGLLRMHRQIIRLSGMEIDVVEVDDAGIRVDGLCRTQARAVLTTPAHQYPFGATLSPSRRAELVAWADDRQGVIIEDDYDGEFRYDRRPIGALQALSPERVVYAGTARKSLGAGLRLGWLVVPDDLRDPLLRSTHMKAGVLVD